MVHKTLHIKLKLWNTNRGELGSFGMVRSSCSTCGTHRVGVKQQSLTHSNGNGLITYFPTFQVSMTTVCDCCLTPFETTSRMPIIVKFTHKRHTQSG
jgi:hypothetical protein